MFVTLFSSFFQVSFRSDYFIFSIDRHCQEVHWLKRRCVIDHDWSWKSQSKCDRRRDVNAKIKKEMRRQKIYAKITRMRILNENLDFDRMQKTSEYLYEKSIDFSNTTKAKRYWFRRDMLLQTSRIWTFRIFINRRILIDCRYRDTILTHRRLTESCEEDELIWSCNRFIELYSSVFLFMSLLSYRLYIKDSSFNVVDCEDVTNRTHAFLMSL